MEEDEVLVSICCITYNQEKYIKDALEGFLMQKTNFKFEIIIHDDASTDDTANIIKQYEKKYPDIIKPIYQIQNQYLVGKKASLITFQEAKGKYIAFCEGDDYWISDNKLQQQVDYMEKHEKCTFCFHNAKELYMKTNKMVTYIDKKRYGKYLKSNGIYAPDDILMIGYGGRIPTASFMFRSQDVKKLPDWYNTSICADMPLKLIMTSFGYGYYIDEEMSVYRRQTGISVTDMWNHDIDNKIERLRKFIEIIDNFNQFTNYKYNNGLTKVKKYYEVDILYHQKKYKQIFHTELAQIYKELYNDKYYIKHYVKKYCKQIYKIYKRIVNK